MADDELLAEQVDYYRARAPEYDHWWNRTHQYELEPDLKATWDRDVVALQTWLEAQAPLGRVLELACGTGIWTHQLAAVAGHITAVDASPEVLAINRSKSSRHAGGQPGAATIDYVEADLFTWRPQHVFDTVFLSFWVSHVPPERFAEFWEMVAASLRPGGRALYIDNRWSSTTWPPVRPEGFVQERSDLSDGRRFRIVKHYYDPDELEEALAKVGWTGRTEATSQWFIYGSATTTG
jgi:SAM-dependent methyltransferase